MIIPKLKIFFFICDPIKRIISHLRHCEKEKYSLCKNFTQDQIFEMLKITFEFLDHALQIYESEKIRKNLFEHVKKSFQSLKEDDFFILMRYLTMSAYDFIISKAFEIIGEDNVHLVDGVNVVENPKDEFSKLLRFLGADDSIDFRFQNEKGFYCLSKPLDYCLGNDKGRTRATEKNDGGPKNHVIYDPFDAKNSYSPSMLSLYKKVNDCNSQTSCCEKSTGRMKWMKNYFC